MPDINQIDITQIFEECLYWQRDYTASVKKFDAYDRLTAISFAKFKVLEDLIESMGLYDEYKQWIEKEKGGNG